MSDTKLRSAATVVLIRDSDSGPEVLMLKRNKALLFAGGVWVFPGGALDPEDWQPADCSEERAARIGAAREAQEEAGIDVDPDLMVQISHWTTPVVEPKRFGTWFFLALAPDSAAITIDGGEIHAWRWINIREAVARHQRGDLGLYPPTIMTLRSLVGYMTAEDALIGVASRDPFTVFPVFADTRDPVEVLFEGDAGYATGAGAAGGPRHRAQLVQGAWHYLCEDLPVAQVRLDS